MTQAADFKTKDFLEKMETLISKGIVRNYQEVVVELNWNKSVMSSVRNGQLPVPQHIYARFNEIYGEKLREMQTIKADETTPNGLLDKYVALLEKRVRELEVQQSQIQRLEQRLDQLLSNQLASEAISQAYQEYVIEVFWKLQGEKVNGKNIVQEIHRKAVEKMTTFSESGIQVS